MYCKLLRGFYKSEYFDWMSITIVRTRILTTFTGTVNSFIYIDTNFLGLRKNVFLWLLDFVACQNLYTNFKKM